MQGSTSTNMTDIAQSWTWSYPSRASSVLPALSVFAAYFIRLHVCSHLYKDAFFSLLHFVSLHVFYAPAIR